MSNTDTLKLVSIIVYRTFDADVWSVAEPDGGHEHSITSRYLEKLYTDMLRVGNINDAEALWVWTRLTYARPEDKNAYRAACIENNKAWASAFITCLFGGTDEAPGHSRIQVWLCRTPVESIENISSAINIVYGIAAQQKPSGKCADCEGTGKYQGLWTPEEPCSACGGNG